MTAWPASLPQKPATGGWNGGPQDNRVSFQPEVGPNIDRRRGTARAHIYDARYAALTVTQLNTFVAFFETDLSDGIDTFTWTDPVYADAGVWRFMPSSPPYTISEIGGDLYDLTFKVMRVPS